MKISSTVASEARNLNGEAVAKVDYLVENFTAQSKMEHRSALRTRISVEEVLLRWMDHFGEGTAFSLSMGYHWHQPYLSLELSGEVCNPLLDGGDADEWNSILLSKLGLVPHYTYEKGKNCIYLAWKSPIVTLRCCWWLPSRRPCAWALETAASVHRSVRCVTDCGAAVCFPAVPHFPVDAGV